MISWVSFGGDFQLLQGCVVHFVALCMSVRDETQYPRLNTSGRCEKWMLTYILTFYRKKTACFGQEN